MNTVLCAESMVTRHPNGIMKWYEMVYLLRGLNMLALTSDLYTNCFFSIATFMGRQTDHGKMIRFLLSFEHVWWFG